MMKYYLGIDNGGTTTKAAVFSAIGKEIGSASVSTAAICPRADYVERDMEQMWLDNCSAVRKALDNAGLTGDDISGVAVCGHGKGLYLWGKDDRPVRNGIISTDNRAFSIVEKWRQDGTEKAAFEITLQHILSCQPVALLAWLKQYEPKAYSNIRWIFECKDYIRYRLTGEARGELTDYSGTGLLDLNTRSYNTRITELFGISEIDAALPPLCTASEICGYITAKAAAQTGLKEGTPVAGGMFDIDACALATGVVDPENICMIAGTWSINEYLSPTPVVDGSVLMNSIYCLPEYYLIEESSPTSAGNNEWYCRQLLKEAAQGAGTVDGSIYDIEDQWAASIEPTEFVPVFLPFLMASNVHPSAKSAFIGITANMTRAHLTRAVYEGIAFSHRYHLEKLLATRDEPPRAVRLAGGVARSSVWTQIFADVIGFPVETVSACETGALGCAIAAAAAVGDYSSVDEAVAAMCDIAPAVMPDRGLREAYNKKYHLYLSVINAMDSVWDEMRQMIGG